MATSTELLRAAEHMRKRANDIAAAHVTPFARDAAAFEIRKMADELEREAARLRIVEAKRAKTYCSDAVARFDGAEMLVEETPSAFAMRFKADPDNSLHLGKNCNVVTSERFLLGLCREVLK